AEAGADVLPAQQRIGGNPGAQVAGKLACVLHGGFWHQDDEFVAAITRDDVGAAAIGFENLADTLKNQVAFQVAVEVIDELEAVQIHEYECEGAPRACRTFPFRRERFHEEAVRLDAVRPSVMACSCAFWNESAL